TRHSRSQRADAGGSQGAESRGNGRAGFRRLRTCPSHAQRQNRGRRRAGRCRRQARREDSQLENGLMPALLLQISKSPLEQAGSMTSPIIQYFEALLALGAVLLLAFLILRVGLPRFFGTQNFTGGPIQVIARYPLEPKKTLYVVKAGSEFLFLGASEAQ